MYNLGAGISRCQAVTDLWCPCYLKEHLETKESIDDFKSLRLAVEDAFSSLILSAIIENEYLTNVISLHDARVLQQFSLRNYLESFGSIKHNIFPDDLLKKGMLDMGKYNLQPNIRETINSHKDSLRKWTIIHEFYSFRKGHAMCEFDKWESVVSEAKENESLWINCNHELAYKQNLSLLRDVTKTMDGMSVDADRGACRFLNIKFMMLAEINREYSEELIKEFNRREDNDEDHIRFKLILRNRVLEAHRAEFQAKKLHYLPKDYQLMTNMPLLSVLSPSLFHARALKVAMLVKGQAGGTYWRGLTNTLLVNGEAGGKYLSGLANTLLVGGQNGRKTRQDYSWLAEQLPLP